MHCLNPCWLRSLISYGITKTEWVKSISEIHFPCWIRILDCQNLLDHLILHHMVEFFYLYLQTCHSFQTIIGTSSSCYSKIIDYLFENLKWKFSIPWWRHQMETFSALLALCVGNSPVTDEFPSERLVMPSFDVFFDEGLNKQLSKQSRHRWFEMPSHSLWRQCNAAIILITVWSTKHHSKPKTYKIALSYLCI